MSFISKLLTLSIIVLFSLMVGSIFLFVPIQVPSEVNSADEINETELQELTYVKLNDKRSERGIQRLSQNNDVEEIAIYKTDRMISEDYIAHEAPDGENVRDRFSLFDINCRTVGENLAKTFYDRNVDTSYKGSVNYQSMEELSDGIVSQFMNSPSHKESLLDENWESHGLSIQINANNEVYITHKFCG